jgi:8-oxo-dGTP diphosphatase
MIQEGWLRHIGPWIWDRLPQPVRAAALRFYPWPQFRVGVLALVVNARGEVLLLRHRFRAGDPWGLPGGWLEPREDPRQGLARELQEELGLALDPASPELVAALSRENRGHIELFYRVPADVGEVAPNVEFHEARTFAVDSLPREMLPLHRDLVTRVAPVTPTGATSW